MLSIGKLAAGQARYYLDQADGRVDVVESVGDGVEDYYVGAKEARGAWIGAGAARLRLTGDVAGPQLRQVLSGIDPASGAALRVDRVPVRVAGFDLTFSAPKSVSIVFGIADPSVRDAVRAAHDRAVLEAVAYLERSAAMVRRGAGGATVLPAGGLVAAAFRHRTSRAGDPQLHTHVLVANLGRGPDGRWSALDARAIYAHSRAASFVYQAVLRSELTRVLGLGWGPVRKGIAEIDGVPPRALRMFSRRRAEIEAALRQRDVDGPRAAEAAALATRQRKSRNVDGEELADGWRQRAAMSGPPGRAVSRLLGRTYAPTMDPTTWAGIRQHLSGPDGLTKERSTFARADLVEAICQALPAGAPIDARAVESAARDFLASRAVVALVGETGQGTEGETAWRRRDGRAVFRGRHERRYSTVELLAVEQRLINGVLGAQAAGIGKASRGDVERALAAHPELSREQRKMVHVLALGGAGVAVVAGRAGTGKTFALDAARPAWQAGDYEVIGAAVARRAARALQDGSGIPSTSIAALLGYLREGEQLPERAVVVIREAGMVGTRQLAELVDHAQRAGAKLVLVGDHRQLPALEAGGAFRALVRRGLGVELTENRRQTHAWERTAVDLLRRGHAEQALALYKQHGRIVVASTADEARDRLVADWWAAGSPDRSVMIAQRRVDVADLNRRARAHMRAAGRLGQDELSLPGGSFAVGDIVVVKRNDPRADLHNGDRAWCRPSIVPARRSSSTATGAGSTSDGASCTREPTMATLRSSTATRSPGISRRASPSTAGSCWRSPG